MYEDIRNAGKSSSPYMKWCPDYHSATLYAMKHYCLVESTEICECITEARNYNDTALNWQKSNTTEMYLFPKWIKLFASKESDGMTIPRIVKEECTGNCTPKAKYDKYVDEVVKIFADPEYVSEIMYKMPG